MSADTADIILVVSLKLHSDWLGEPLTDEFQEWRQTHKQIDLIDCWTATFAVKKFWGM